MVKTKMIKQKVQVSATPEQVYDAFMDAKKHSEFTGSKATSNPKVGGLFTAWDGYIYGKHLELEPRKRIVQEWSTTEWSEGQAPSRLELCFKKIKDGTEISMVQTEVPPELVEELAQGWIDFYWEPLKEYFKK
jgi:activator of HSP90 ATPase